MPPQGHQAEGNHLEPPITPPSPADSGWVPEIWLNKYCFWRWGQLSEVALFLGSRGYPKSLPRDEACVRSEGWNLYSWTGANQINICLTSILQNRMMKNERWNWQYNNINFKKTFVLFELGWYIGVDLSFGYGCQGLFFQLREPFRENQNKRLDNILSNKNHVSKSLFKLFLLNPIKELKHLL